MKQKIKQKGILEKKLMTAVLTAVFLFSILSLYSTSTANTAIGLGIAPASITISDAFKGGTYERTITVFNTGDETGTFELTAEGECADWISFYKPDEPDTLITEVRHYRLISRDEGMMKIDFTRANGYYVIHRFKFDIAEPETRITKLDVLWDGMGYAGWGTRGATLYIWNFKTGKYEQLDRKADVFITLEGSISEKIKNKGSIFLFLHRHYRSHGKMCVTPTLEVA